MMIEAIDLVKDYSGHRALDGLNLQVKEGSVYGLLGPNGAGKTTFIRIVNQITRPDSGKVLFNGEPLTEKHIGMIGYLPEERGLYKKMTVGEQAVFFAQLKGLSRKEALVRLKYWFSKLEIESWWNKKVEELSKGMAQKVQFIVTVLHEPKLLIFDEPFSGFDPVNANILKREIMELAQKGATILFSTHNMSSVEEVCDEITLINKSKNVLSGRVCDVKQQFKDNVFNIRFMGTAEQCAAISPVVDVIESTESNGMVNALVRAKDDAKASAIIRNIVDRVELVGFEEVLPSMNEIFLKVVGQKD